MKLIEKLARIRAITFIPVKWLKFLSMVEGSRAQNTSNWALRIATSVNLSLLHLNSGSRLIMFLKWHKSYSNGTFIR